MEDSAKKTFSFDIINSIDLSLNQARIIIFNIILTKSEGF